MEEVVKAYYKLTSWVPRPMPQNDEEITKLKEVFMQAFGVEDSPQVWYTIFSNIAGTKNTSVRIYYRSLANIAKRLDINKLLQDQKQLEYQQHMDKLEETAEKAINEAKEREPVACPDESLMPSGPSDT